MKIHPTALVESGAELADDVEIGPFAVIESGVRLGAGCVIRGHAQLVGSVILGERCEVGHGAVIGADPQDLGFDRCQESGVIAGAGNLFREHVTIHRSASPQSTSHTSDSWMKPTPDTGRPSQSVP